MPEISYGATYWYSRYKYRAKFGLSSAQMDEEPIDEYQINALIMKLETDREELEQRRRQQQHRE